MDVQYSNRIKELRAKNDLTQEDLANKVNVRRETIGHIEKGKYNLSLGLAFKISRALNENIEDVFIVDD
ncbi:helix-turn-helix transcriptional regulator [Methanosalsum natronophilum]|uniref:helix-turn-helix transcriptional regulator n=1 Tax=Methanosalsum natronophilum TaxID=768733 RepID=UPI002167A9A2|nr:helix-turn-helix transcriptional regulator [Methanosalsum natronophilum]MCS3923605.1 DNA-binding XRE family transcriptional regulator [Methanosalsum natronophilum]